jgi:uncharacterized protein CbrC (UPF0167 family)
MQASESLPVFKYHPDPVATGSVRVDPDTPCLGCNRIRGYIYTGPVYTSRNFILDDHLCPWCIADGSAARKFDATFTDTGTTEGISDDVRGEVEARTPGFTGWQQETWLACCGDAAAFLGVAGAEEIERDFPEAAAAVRQFLRNELELSEDDTEEILEALTRDGEPSAYIFRCLHCGKYLAYVDQT